MKSAEMIAGKIENVVAISLAEGEESSHYQAQIENALQRLTQGTVVFADLFGGTPCNCSAALSRNHSIGIVRCELLMLLALT